MSVRYAEVGKYKEQKSLKQKAINGQRVRVAVLFHRVGPYHYARLRAAGARYDVVAVEFCSADETYAWDRVEGSDSFQRVILFCDRDVSKYSGSEVLRRVTEVLSDIQPDAVAIPGWSEAGALAALHWCITTGAAAVVMSDSNWGDRPRRWWKEAIKRQVVRLYRAGLVAGQLQKEYLSRLGMPAERIFNGYDVVDNAHFAAGAGLARKHAAELRKEHKLPERYFLASGRFIEEKNLRNLITAYGSYVQQYGPDAWHLVLLGEGPLRHEIHMLIEKLGVTDQVHLPGFKQYHNLPAYYGLAGAFILASTTETWGLVVNEAMASGLPVIVSNRCGCVRDLVESGRNGFIFDPYSTKELVKLMSDITHISDRDRSVMGLASREIIDRWTPKRFADGLQKSVDAALTRTRNKVSRMDKALLSMLIHL